jgi:hypothetical protein
MRSAGVFLGSHPGAGAIGTSPTAPASDTEDLKMKNSVVVVSVLALAACSVFGQNSSDNSKPSPNAAKPAATFTQPKAENLPTTPEADAWLKAAQPGTGQKQLATLVGPWNCEVRFSESTNTPEQKSTGTMINRFVLGGRFLETAFNANIEGQVFQGTGVWGFNNITNQFESTWIDTMSTGIVFESGKFDANTKTFTMSGRYANPTGGFTTQKTVYTIESSDKYTISSFEVASDGKETKTMTIICTKLNGSSAATNASNTQVKNNRNQSLKTASPTPTDNDKTDK